MSGWSVALLVLVGLAYLLRNWRDLQLAFTLTSLLSLSFLRLQESPRWLLAKGKHQEAAAVLRQEVTLETQQKTLQSTISEWFKFVGKLPSSTRKM